MAAQNFQVIPAVDLLGREVVRLEQGDFDRVCVRESDPVARVARLAAAGAGTIHVVDLDGARSGRLRPEVIAVLVRAAAPARVQASGGIRSVADAQALLRAGAERVVVGTAAWAKPESLGVFADALEDRLVVAIDVRAGRVAVRGWQADTGLDAAEAAVRCASAGVCRLLCTAVERDGTLAGPDLELLEGVGRRSGLPVIAAGGIASAEDLEAVAALGCEAAIVGRALYGGTLPLAVLGEPNEAPRKFLQFSESFLV